MKPWHGAAAFVVLAAIIAAVVVWPHANSETSQATAPLLAANDARFIIAGGGPVPESNEVSIEDDLRLATQVFPGPGVTLYASGPGSKAVRVEADDLPVDELVAQLAALFNPRPGRQSRYRAATLDAAGPATPDELLRLLTKASATGTQPLNVYLAGHGGPGEDARSNTIAMWANMSVTPADLAAATEGSKRPTRFVITTCFSGGFAELAFRDADPAKGAHSAPICGLFASTADQEAGGCDPNPDRGMHDGYGVHFLSALDGKKRDGSPLAAEILDIDGDGKVSLLDAHTFARLSSRSIDVPTTTSERWLRQHAKDEDGGAPLRLAHEEAVVGVLGKLMSDASAVTVAAELARVEAALKVATEEESAAASTETDAFYDASAAILARWPVLDDPWHPLWRSTIDSHRAEIRAFLDSSPAVAALDQAMVATNKVSAKRAQLEVERAPIQRIARAHQTMQLAGALQRQGGAAWDHYVALRDCENAAP